MCSGSMTSHLSFWVFLFSFSIFFSVVICTSLKIYQVIEWSENACFCFSKPAAIFAGSSLFPSTLLPYCRTCLSSKVNLRQKNGVWGEVLPSDRIQATEASLGVSYTCSSTGWTQLWLLFRAPLKALLVILVNGWVSLHIYVSGWKKSQHLAPLCFVHRHTQMVTLLPLATSLTTHAPLWTQFLFKLFAFLGNENAVEGDKCLQMLAVPTGW